MTKKDQQPNPEATEEQPDATTTEMPEGDDVGAPEQPLTDSEVEALQTQIDQQKDKYLRLLSEFDNYKKRSNRERIDLIKTAAGDTLKALLPVLDDFDRAKKNAEADDSTEQFSEGVSLVYDKLHKTLQAKGLKPMQSDGESFDPELHEALTEIPAPSDDLKGKVVDTIERGYYLGDKILRHAKVVVGK